MRVPREEIGRLRRKVITATLAQNRPGRTECFEEQTAGVAEQVILTGNSPEGSQLVHLLKKVV